jgi:Skp family chaperone for outer membrane proteins
MRVAAVLAVLFAAALAAKAQNNPAPAAARSGVLNLRDCMDKTRNTWIAEIDAEVQKMQEADSGRVTDLNPKERTRIRNKILDHSNRRRNEVYTEIVRLSGVVAKERGFDLIQRVDPMPVVESGDTDFAAQLERRPIVHFDPSIDITGEVLERLNREHAAKKK